MPIATECMSSCTAATPCHYPFKLAACEKVGKARLTSIDPLSSRGLCPLEGVVVFRDTSNK